MEKDIKLALTKHKEAFELLEEQSSTIAKIACLFNQSLEAGGKIIFIGNGGSAADAQHLAAELVGRFRKNRKALAALALTTDSSILTAVGNDFGFEEIDLKNKDFLEPDQVIQLGFVPLRIDILTSIRGVAFKSAWENRKIYGYGDIKANFISKQDLIKNKRALGRTQDLADLEKLEKI